MNPIVTTSIDPLLATLSFAFAVIGSFIALSAASRIREARGRLNFGNIVVAGVALGGIGVWSMHFVGMLALKMDTASSYAVVETLASLVAAIVATSLTVRYAAKAPEQLSRLLAAGVFLGMSVVVMHYLGMYGLKINGYIQWNYGLVALSIAIAVVAATVALWLAFNSSTIGKRLAAAVIMGVAVCAMHYTGMLAAEFICTTDNRNAIPQGFGFFPAFELPALVIVSAVTMGIILSIQQWFQAISAKPMAAKLSRN
ncbi:histidine kinase [Hydrogenophaga crassostreae]|uniref:Histidine kinase n=1 Tax=Hydrogenophaga crassostreae TaxID=1763535 RepID=A0A167HXM1_9BURK|nr:MHYT domain-containing protein [Hydrogenophaga crassostreae]AOW13576.1 histidine kinase [Hydrogenophaga crassostreae]OAD41870.1 histidine kinase [Hydrogenophaga crassostreae]